LTFALLAAATLLTAAPALAMAAVNAAMVSAAIDYGRSGAKAPLAEFLAPWTVYEERAAGLDETEERACVYTPFLLVAAEARDRTRAGGPMTRADAERVLGDYRGYVIFGVTLFGEQADFAARLTARALLGRRTLRPALVHLPPAAEATADGSRFWTQLYLYFPDKDFRADSRAVLQVTTADGRRRSFSFLLAGYR